MTQKIDRRLKIDEYEQNQFWKHYYGLRQEISQPNTQGEYVGRVFREVSESNGWKSRYKYKHILSFASHIAKELNLKILKYTGNDNRTINCVFVG